MSHKNIIKTLLSLVVLKNDENQYKISNNMMIKSILRILGYVSIGKEEDTHKLIQANIADFLIQMLESPIKVFNREAGWILSNCFAAPHHITYPLLEKKDLIDCILEKIVNGSEHVKLELSYCLNNMIYCNNIEVIPQFLKDHKDTIFHNLIECLGINLCSSGDSNVKFIMNILGIIENLLIVGTQINQY